MSANTRRKAGGEGAAAAGAQRPLLAGITHGASAGAQFSDSAAAENKSLPIHRWVPWIAGYSGAFVDDVIATYLGATRGAQVLDPFCGVGTTLVQTVHRGHQALGFELNPYAALACRAKLAAFTADLAALDAMLADLERASATWAFEPPPASVAPPPLRSRLPFFSPGVEGQVLHLLAYLRGLENPGLSDLVRVALGAVMVSFSNYTYEPSLGSRPAAGKPLVEMADVAAVVLGKLRAMRADIAVVQAAPARPEPPAAGRVVLADFFAAQAQVPDGSVNLVLTSPPYLNNYHYVRNTRPQLYWLDFIAAPAEQRALEVQNFGQYWQTVRGGEPLALTFEHPALEAVLRRLRATRPGAGAYGGPGWANYVARYFNDCERLMQALARVLAPGGVSVVVIGNSIIQGRHIRTEQWLADLGERHGLERVGLYCLREKRVGASITRSSVRQGRRSRATLAEYAVVLRQR